MPTDPATPLPTRGRLLLRGGLRRCPVCGGGKLFQRWFRMRERCQRCGFVFERAEGHWIGAVGINTVVCFGLLLVVLVVAFVATYPEPSFWPIFGAAVATAALTPVLFYPFSKTIWSAIDLAMRPLTQAESDAAAATLSETASRAEGDRDDRTRRGPRPT